MCLFQRGDSLTDVVERQTYRVHRSSRVRTHEEQRRWSQSISAIRGGWATLLLGFLVVTGTAVFVLALPTNPVFKGVLAGVLFASAFWAPFTVVTVATYSATTGSWGESFTKDLLQRHRPPWPVVHDVPMQGRNVDHVAVSPRAVLAIETKYIGGISPWEKHTLRERFLGQARDSARSVRLLLRSADMRLNIPVEPVLMLWGPGAPKHETWTRYDDVIVVAGRNARQFLKDWSVGEITEDEGREVKAGLERYQSMRRQYERSQPGARRTP